MKFELPYKPSPRFPRYTHAFLIPSIVMLAAGFYELMKLKRTVFIAVLVTFLASSIVEAYILYKIWKEPFTDVKEASKFLLTLPEKPIYSDYWLLDRFDFDARYKKNHLIPWGLNGKSLQLDIIEKGDFAELEKAKNVYVVVGGSRAIHAGMPSVFNLGTFKPPNNWKLIKEIPKKITSYRNETLKIFEVTGE